MCGELVNYLASFVAIEVPGSLLGPYRTSVCSFFLRGGQQRLHYLNDAGVRRSTMLLRANGVCQIPQVTQGANCPIVREVPPHHLPPVSYLIGIPVVCVV